MRWICANCAARHATNDPPCWRCGHDVFVRPPDDRSSEDAPADDRRARDDPERDHAPDAPRDSSGRSPDETSRDDAGAATTSSGDGRSWANPDGPLRRLRYWIWLIVLGSVGFFALYWLWLSISTWTYGHPVSRAVLQYAFRIFPHAFWLWPAAWLVDAVAVRLGYGS